MEQLKIKKLGFPMSLAVFALAGCATTLPTLQSTKPVPIERLTVTPSPGAETASITIVRDSAFAGSLVNYRILIDGIVMARIAAGEFVALSVPAGDRIIEVRHPSESLGAAGDAQTVHVEKGSNLYFRINSDLGQIKLLPTTAASVGAQQYP